MPVFWTSVVIAPSPLMEPPITKVYWNENIVWSPGYFVSSVGVDEETIKKYVELQGDQDLGQIQLKL